MNSKQVASILVVAVGFFVAANGRRGHGHGHGSSNTTNSTNLYSCQPIDRIFVRPGAICFQLNTTMQSCSNHTCRCTAKPFVLPPLPGTGNSSTNSSSNSTTRPTPIIIPFAFKLPSLPPIPRWNCTRTHSNSTTNTTTTAVTSLNSTSTTTLAPGGSSSPASLPSSNSTTTTPASAP